MTAEQYQTLKDILSFVQAIHYQGIILIVLVAGKLGMDTIKIIFDRWIR